MAMHPTPSVAVTLSFGTQPLIDCEQASSGTTTTESGASNASKPNSRIRFRKRKYTKEGLLQEEDTETLPTRPDESKRRTTHAMTVLRAFDSNEKYEYSSITIEDDGLRAFLLHALSHHPDFSHPGIIMLNSLFEPLIHNWSLLNDLADTASDSATLSDLRKLLKDSDSTSSLAPLRGFGKLETAASDLRQLLDQVRDTPGLENYFSGVREMQEIADTINFDYLWTSFPPGELVLSQTYMDRRQVFIVKESTDYISERRRTNERSWRLECWTYDWNGTVFNRIPVEFIFEQFKGSGSITSLHCYPLKFHREGSDGENAADHSRSHDIKEALIKRGKRYRDLCLKNRGKQIFEYDGLALSRGTGVRKINKVKQASLLIGPVKKKA